MDNNKTTLKILKCRELLDLFQKERRLFLTKEKISPTDLLPLLQLKKKLLDIFTAPKNEQDKTSINNNKNELRELSSLLEELLVIDRENEILMHKMLDQKAGDIGKRRSTHTINKNNRLTSHPHQPKSGQSKTKASQARRSIAVSQLNRNRLNNNKYI